jgi:hypothetical protein
MLKAKMYLQQMIVSTRDGDGKPTGYVLGFAPATSDGPLAPTSTLSIPVKDVAGFWVDKTYELSISPAK